MSSVVKRYKQLIADALARYFPHTTAYLHAERQAQTARVTPAKRSKKPVGNKPRKSAKAASAAQGVPKKKSTTRSVSGIFPASPLAITTEQVSAMQAEVAQAVNAGQMQMPSSEQWQMILCPHPLTRVFAGAGSGKSTTLVLRALFMLRHLQVKPEQMTIISFTNASCAELREQLLKVAGFLGHELSVAQAGKMVRTFHSAMAQMAKSALPSTHWFEQLDERQPKPDELDNPLLGSRLKPVQQRLLKQVYQQCYSEQPRFRQLVHALLKEPEPGSGKPKAPMTPFALVGEFAAVPLPEAFYAQGGFIESIGVRITQIDLTKLACPEPEKQFVEALMLFWAAFQQALHAQGLVTFSGAFQQLGEQVGNAGKAVGAPLFEPFTHLLIDEFQDISPQIVQWLQAVLRARSQQGAMQTFMAIGDDWQSIYGWRGSSPELFMQFDRYFPCKGRGKRSAVLMLSTNYRSIEPIIRDAEAVLAPVTSKQPKDCVANRVAEQGDHGVKLIQRFDLNKRLPELLEQIRQQCELAQQRKRERTAVLLLSRRNEPLQQVLAALDKKLPVKAYTIHRAKGLQGEVAIILDDCWPAASHPLRNALYAYSGFFTGSYDQAMQDENLRLAYVAITRGVSRVFWYCQKAQGATGLLAKRSS